MNKPRAEKSFTADDVKVTYEELNSTGRYIATLSWTPFDSKWNTNIVYAVIEAKKILSQDNSVEAAQRQFVCVKEKVNGPVMRHCTLDERFLIFKPFSSG